MYWRKLHLISIEPLWKPSHWGPCTAVIVKYSASISHGKYIICGATPYTIKILVSTVVHYCPDTAIVVNYGTIQSHGKYVGGRATPD